MKQAVAQETEHGLSSVEQHFLQSARAMFRDNVDWFQFEDFAFGSRSPLFSATRSHRDVLSHPLYIALKDMWLQLGVRQGRVAPDTDATRRQTTRRR
jgi:hypothetical protein